MKVVEFWEFGPNPVFINPEHIVCIVPEQLGSTIVTSAKDRGGAQMIFYVTDTLEQTLKKLATAG